jgi:RHS repeat-associated protein
MPDGQLNLTDQTDQSDFEQRAQRIQNGDYSANGKDDDIRQAIGAYLQEAGLPDALISFVESLLQDILGAAADTIASIVKYIAGANAGTVQFDGTKSIGTATTAGEPVDLATGQFVHSTADFVVAGAGINFAFIRTYRSGAYYLGPLGANWDHAYNLWLRINVDQSISVTTGQLREIRYFQHQSFPYYVAIGEDSILTTTADNAFEQQWPDGRVARFEQVGDADGTIYRIVRLADRFGNNLDFTYDGQIRLYTVTVNHPARLVSFNYDDQSRIQSITLFPVTYTTVSGQVKVSRTWTYTYDDFGDLVAVTGPSTDEFPLGRTTQYSYSSVSSSEQRQHDLLSMTDPNGTTYLENEYGSDAGTVAFGKVVRQRLGSGVFLFQYCDIIPDPSWTFEDAARPTSCVTVVQRDGHSVRYVLNDLGNILSAEETIVEAGEQTILWRYSYDADGRRTATLSPEGRLSQIYYGRTDFYRRQVSPGDPSVPMWEDPNLSAAEHARFGNVIASVQRSAKLTLNGALDDLAIYGDVFPDVLVVVPDDIIAKASYESKFQQLATISDPRYTASPDPAAPESLDPNSPYSKHLTVTSFRGDPGATPISVTYPDTTYPAPLSNGQTGIIGARRTFDLFDPNGALRHWTEPEGNAYAYEYFTGTAAQPTIQGYLAASVAGVGVVDLRTTFLTNEAGELIAVTDPRGNTTQYAIDPFSLPRTLSLPIAGYQIDYSFDGNIQVISRKVAIIDPDGSVVRGSPEVATFTYNAEMSVVATGFGDSSRAPARVTQYVYDSSNRVVHLVLPRGNSICYRYDERSLLKELTRGCCTPDAAISRRAHDLDGALIATTDPRGFQAASVLDAFARAVQVTDPLGNLQRVDYDKRNNPVVRRWFGTRANGSYPLLRRSEYLYDERGHLIRERRAFFSSPILTLDPWGSADAEFNAAVQSGQVQWNDTLTYYDGNERIFQIVDPNSHATTMEYDAADRLVATTDPAGNTTRSTYDPAGNIIRVDRYLVDSAGNVQAVLSNLREFDPLNRLSALTDGAGNRVTRGLDSRGFLRTLTDALGNVKNYSYNGYRDCVATTDVLQPLGGGAPAGLTTASSFDPNSNVDSITDPNGNVTRFQYDALDRPRVVVNADGSSRTMQYDPSSNLTDTFDEGGLHVTRTYDGLGRLTGIAVQQPQGPSAEQWAQFTYDGVGMLVTHANSFLSVNRNVDSLGQCYQETLTYGPPLDVFPSPLVLMRQFDPGSNRIGLTYPSGQTLRYDFSADNRLTQLQSLANAAPYPGDPGAAGNRSIIQKQRWGELLVSSQFGNGATVTSAHDAAGRRVSDECGLPNGQNYLLQQLWDGAGNRALTIEMQTGNPIGWWHAYDSTKRLLSTVSLPNPQPVITAPLAPPNVPIAVFRCQQDIDAIVSSYGMSVPSQPDLAYDAAGNRATTNFGSSVNYTTNARDEYVTVRGAPLSYDRTGRLIADARFNYAYNFRGQLVQVASQTNGNVLLQIFHNANGLPIGIVQGTQKQVLVLDGANPVEIYDRGVLSALLLWEGPDQLTFFAASGKDQYLFRDVLSSSRLTSDSQGAATSILRYDPFGNLTMGSPLAPFLYCGKYFYAQPGWYEYRNRQYIPSLGRFAQPDPAGFIDGANPYTFVGNNPLSAIDPTGLDRQNVARGAASESEQIRYITYKVEDVYRHTTHYFRLPAEMGVPDWVPGWIPTMPYGRMMTIVDWEGEPTPPPLVDAEDPLSPPPLVDAPADQPPPRPAPFRPIAPTWHRPTPPAPTEQPFVPISDEEHQRLVKKNNEDYKRGIEEIRVKRNAAVVRAIATTATEKVAEWEGYVSDFCTVVPVCGPYGKVAEVISETAEIINIAATAYYEGLDAGGGKAARKVFNTAVEKGLTKLFERKHLPKPIAEKFAHFLGKGFDKAIGEMVEYGSRGTINRLMPTGPTQLPPGAQ